MAIDGVSWDYSAIVGFSSQFLAIGWISLGLVAVV